jgi:predicted aspartyl protease
MGIVYVDGVVKYCGKSVKARLLMDSGTTYTVLTESVWKELGLEPLS